VTTTGSTSGHRSGSLLLAAVLLLAALSAGGCRPKETKPSSDYYTGPMTPRGSMVGGNGAGSPNTSGAPADKGKLTE
jgi:hypothetical protein